MPATTTTIDRDQRQALYKLVCNHLGGFDDLWLALEHAEDFVEAERWGGDSPTISACWWTSAGQRRTSARRST